jgi:alkylation response protein AidB-like acyl-CoA dehydrogenase
VDARLTSEQEALRDAAAAIVRDHAARTVRSLGDADRAARLLRHVEEAGLFELRAGQPGTPPGTSVETALVAEQLALGAAEVPFVGPTLAADLLRRAGVPLAGQRFTVALDATFARLATPGVAERAVAIDAADATHALLLIAGSGGHGLAASPIAGKDVTVDLTRPVGAIQPTADLLSLAPLGALTDDDLDGWRAFGQAVLAADLLGSLGAAHAMAVGYAKEREQYGRPVAAFQAMQHLLADSLVWFEGARSAAHYAAWAVDAEEPGAAREAALVAKTYCSIAARSACEIAIQVHGGIGNTWDCMAHVHLRRVLSSTQVLGDDGALLEEIAGLRQGEFHGLPG